MKKLFTVPHMLMVGGFTLVAYAIVRSVQTNAFGPAVTPQPVSQPLGGAKNASAAALGY